MRHCRTVVVGLSATIATTALDGGLEHARAAQARGTLQVSVQVTAPCAASLGDRGQLAMQAGCAALTAPFTVANEGAAPSLTSKPGDGSPAPVVEPAVTSDLRYITLLY